MTKKFVTICSKFHLAIVIVVLLIAALIAIAITLQFKTARRSALIEAENVADSVAIAGIQDPINDLGFLRKKVSDLHDVYGRDIAVVDVQKRVLADADPEEVGTTFSGDFDNSVGKTLHDGLVRTFLETDSSFPAPRKQIVVPFRKVPSDKTSEIVGATILEYSQIYEALMAEVSPFMYLMAALGSIFMLVITMMGLRFVSRISTPLIKLTQVASELREGAFTARAKIGGDDEIAILALSFNEMADELQKTNTKLHNYQQKLEKRVALRTSELAESNSQLKEEVAERKRAEVRLAFLAKFDSLTRLPNRHMLHNYLATALKEAQAAENTLGCLFIDLDRFKTVNDTYGHYVGDLLLTQFSKRLKDCVRGADIVARLGGDEFAVVLPTIGKPEDADTVAQKIIDSLSQPFVLNGREIHTSASIGVAVYPKDGNEIDELLKNADFAMYQAKQNGGNNFQLHSPQMKTHAVERVQLESLLRGALERDEFLLDYQPKVNLTSGKICGFEALLRWHPPQLGLVPPGRFISILEEIGMIVPVGEWVLKSVCGQIKEWRTRGIDPGSVAVNLSARQFQQVELPKRIKDILDSHAIDYGVIQLELTESILMHNPKSAANIMHQLKEMGVKLSIDDFGTGYSSLAYLKQFPLDELKIDQSFVRDVTTDPNNATITLTVINLAHNLRLKVLAEGVETKHQVNFLRSNGCDEMQGYYFAGPMKANDCTQALIEDRRLAFDADLSIVPTILIVDDNKLDLEIIQKALAPSGYRIFVAENPHEAFRMLMEHPANIIISDHNMPTMSGVEFMTSIRNLFPNVVRIVISGVANIDMLTEAVNTAGIDKYLSKDWDAARLRAEVHEAFLRQNSKLR